MAEVDLNTPVIVSLPIGAWNTVMALLMKGPWETANPLLQAINAQVERGKQMPQDQKIPQPRLVDKE